MALDTAPPPGSWVTVYGYPAAVLDSYDEPALRARGLVVQFPPPGRPPCGISISRDRISHVPLSEPSLLPASSAHYTLTGSPEQFEALRRVLTVVRDTSMRQFTISTLDGFLAQLPSGPEPTVDQD